MKDNTNVKEIIEKYLEGQTSLEEEVKLKHHLNSSNIDTELYAYREMFGYFTDTKNEKTTIPALNIPNQNSRWMLKIVAVVLVIVSGTWFYNNQLLTSQANELGTYDDPIIALQETQKVFNMISYHLNAGTKGIKHINTLHLTKKNYIDKLNPNK